MTYSYLVPAHNLQSSLIVYFCIPYATFLQQANEWFRQGRIIDPIPVSERTYTDTRPSVLYYHSWLNLFHRDDCDCTKDRCAGKAGPIRLLDADAVLDEYYGSLIFSDNWCQKSRIVRD